MFLVLLALAFGDRSTSSHEPGLEPVALVAPADPLRATVQRPPKKSSSSASTVRVDASIRAGLVWLARHRNPDGSWSAGELHARCDPATPCFDEKAAYEKLFDTGTTALAVLAFLETGHGPQSDVKLGPEKDEQAPAAGAVVTSALEWLAKRQQTDGQITPQRAMLYNEALASLAFSQAYRRSRDERWKLPAQRSIDFVQKAQRPSPSGEGLWGWRYDSREQVERDIRGRDDLKATLYDADSSVTAWCARALDEAQLAGLKVDAQSVRGALAFAAWVAANNGCVGYMDPKAAGATLTGKHDHFKYHPTAMSALGMTTRFHLTKLHDDPLHELAAKRLVEDLPVVSKDLLTIDYYYWHHGTLALREFDGPNSSRNSNKFWGPWRKTVVDALLSLQNVEKGGCRAGGWIVPDRWCYTAGPIYATSINVLTLALVGR